MSELTSTNIHTGLLRIEAVGISFTASIIEDHAPAMLRVVVPLSDHGSAGSWVYLKSVNKWTCLEFYRYISVSMNNRVNHSLKIILKHSISNARLTRGAFRGVTTIRQGAHVLGPPLLRGPHAFKLTVQNINFSVLWKCKQKHRAPNIFESEGPSHHSFAPGCFKITH